MKGLGCQCEVSEPTQHTLTPEKEPQGEGGAERVTPRGAAAGSGGGGGAAVRPLPARLEFQDICHPWTSHSTSVPRTQH